MADLLRSGNYDAADLVKIPPPTRPAMLKSGGPVMEVIRVDGDWAVCEWPDGRSTFRVACLYSLVPFQNQPETVESAVKAERERCAKMAEDAAPEVFKAPENEIVTAAYAQKWAIATAKSIARNIRHGG